MKNLICILLAFALFFGCLAKAPPSNQTIRGIPNITGQPNLTNANGTNITANETPPTTNITENVSSKKYLANVKTWFYYLDVNIDNDLENMIQSDYDMIVIDPVFTEKENSDYGIKDAVSKIKNSSGSNVKNKIVLAYIDIGQAESYRYYWKPGWKIGNPEFIVGEDPDLWEENYPVAYWKREWQDIWFKGEDAQIKKLIEAGFDGVYLDWIEAYSDENVAAIAKKEGINATDEMISFVSKIKAYGSARDPDFIVIAQNAAELAEFDDYVSSIDAIAQEQVWFDGSALGEPEGDCPLPETDDDIETQKYEDSLSPGCLKMYTELPDSTLHVSSAEYIQYLKTAKSKGLPIFTVDYALEEKNIVLAYNRSRSHGFIPFVSNRPLNQFVEPR